MLRRRVKDVLFVVFLLVCILVLGYVVITVFFLDDSGKEISLSVQSLNEDNLSVYLTPPVSNVNYLFGTLRDAKSEINCVMRSLNYPGFEELIKEKESEGVKTRVVVDSDYLGNKDLYLPYVKFVDLGRGMMHSNYCVIDAKTVVVGSIILNENTIDVNVHDFLVINSSALADRYSSDFWKIYQNQSRNYVNGSLTDFVDAKFSVVFCPYENCENALVELIDSANESIHFAIYSFTNPAIKDALKRAIDRGVVVKGLLEKEGVTDDYSLFYMNLQGVSIDFCSRRIHTKTWVIDGKYALTGSFNPSVNAVMYNYENILSIKDPIVVKFYDAFISELYSSCKNDIDFIVG